MSLGRWTGVERKDQGPAFLTGLGHGGTHWVAGIFYILLPYINRDYDLSYAQTVALSAMAATHAYLLLCLLTVVIGISNNLWHS